MSEWIVVTGGAGYVGSHIAAALKRDTKYKTLVIDQNAALAPHTHAFADEIVNDDYASKLALDVIDVVKPLAIIHCAASSLVTPSVNNPAKYYDNNVCSLLKFMNHLRDNKHNNVIFSSSSSVYGDGDGVTPSNETELLNPIRPYGRTKQAGEMILGDYFTAYGINSIAFRYFNAVGASPKLNLGQLPNASHVIARVMDCLLADTEFVINGTDWPTKDGTCVRDYVHVNDIAVAHVMGISWLINSPGHYVYNIGSGSGYSVLDILSAVERVTGKKVKTVEGPRRPGDPAWRIADVTKIHKELGWAPIHDLDKVVSDAYQWYTSSAYLNMQR